MKKNSGFDFLHRLCKTQARIFLSFLCSFFCLSCLAQSYYYFENKKDSKSYYSFLTVQPDGSAIVRTAAHGNPIIEQKLLDSSMIQRSVEDLKYLVAKGDPIQIGEGKSENIPLRFVFKKIADSTGSFYIPLRTEYADENGKWKEATKITMHEKTYEDLVVQKDFISIFYNEDDAFYQYLYGERERVNSIAPRRERLFLVVVANTNDPKIGKSSYLDFNAITETFTTLAINLGMRIVPTKIMGNDFSKNNVQRALDNLKKQKPAANDIIVFYYSGHGFRFTKDMSAFPRMSLRTNENQDLKSYNFAVEDIYKQILKLKARVNIVIADCCNWDINMPLPQGMDVLRTRGMGLNTTSQSLNMTNCNALFFPMQPVSIIACSAQKNQLAVGNHNLGGFFSYYFKAMLDQSLYTPNKGDSWLRLLLDTKEKARWQALSALCGNNRCVQLATFSVIPAK